MNRETGKHLLHVAGFLLGLAALLAAASRLYEPRDNQKWADVSSFYVYADGYLGHGADELDAIFVGCSEFYASVSPLRIWTASGVTSYNVSTSAQRIYTSDEYIHRILRTHHPKVIVLDGYAAIRPGYADDAAYDMFETRFSIFQYHNNWKKYDWNKITTPIHYTNRVEKKGFRSNDKVAHPDFEGYNAPSEEVAPIPVLNRIYLGHIARLCRAHGVQLVVLYVPSPSNWSYAIHNALQRDTERLGIPFVDLNLRLDEVGIVFDTDFQDEEGDHLNIAGANKMSAYLGHLLAEEYGLPDHRDDPAFAQWNSEAAQSAVSGEDQA